MIDSIGTFFNCLSDSFGESAQKQKPRKISDDYVSAFTIDSSSKTFLKSRIIPLIGLSITLGSSFIGGGLVLGAVASIGGELFSQFVIEKLLEQVDGRQKGVDASDYASTALQAGMMSIFSGGFFILGTALFKKWYGLSTLASEAGKDLQRCHFAWDRTDIPAALESKVAQEFLSAVNIRPNLNSLMPLSNSDEVVIGARKATEEYCVAPVSDMSLPFAFFDKGGESAVVFCRKEGVYYPVALHYQVGEEFHSADLLVGSANDSFIGALCAGEKQFSPYRRSSLHNLHYANLEFPVEGINKLPRFPTVFHPSNPYNIFLLQAALPNITNSHKVLVMGTGSGLEAVTLAKKYQMVVDAVDINPLAVANTRASALTTGVHPWVKAWVSDGFSQVTEKYDCILFNSPIPSMGFYKDINKFDPDGILLKKILADLPSRLSPRGKMYLMSLEDISSYAPDSVEARAVSSFQVLGQRLAIHCIVAKTA